MKAKYSHISAERVCSGKGLENLYSAIKVLDHKFDLPDLEAPEISKNAISGKCAVCKEALDLMLAFLGRISGNLALTLGRKAGFILRVEFRPSSGIIFSNPAFGKNTLIKAV